MKIGLRVNKAIKDRFVCVDDAVACQSGTAALHLSLIEAGVKNDDLVEYTKELIKLRNDLFDYYESSNISFEDYFEVIIVNIDDLKIMINPCPFDHIYAKDAFYETIFDGERRSEIIDSAINVKAYSVAVAKVITKM